jgi:hypothetical protein
METVTFKGSTAAALSPEGHEVRIGLADLVQKMAPRRADTGDLVLPDGVKCVLARGPFLLWVHQTPPRVFPFDWIAEGSPAPFGRGTRYRTVKLGLPYLIVLAVFGPGESGLLQLSQYNECFFRNHPLESIDDELLFPALLNCSKFNPPEGRPLSWICTQHLDQSVFLREANFNRRLRGGLRALLHCLLETGFNYSSEHHEQSSWFTQSARVDPRISTVDKWQAATAKDPLFALEVPWLKTGLTLRQVAERIFQNLKAPSSTVTTASDVARLIFNHRPTS